MSKPKSIADLGCTTYDTQSIVVGKPLFSQEGPLDYAKRVEELVRERVAEMKMLQQGGDNRDGREEFAQLMQRVGRR